MACKTGLRMFACRGKKIIGISTNYKTLFRGGQQRPTEPILFLKSPTSYITPGAKIKIPEEGKVKAQVELGVVIKEYCKNVKIHDAMFYVGGYCVALDLVLTQLEEDRKQGLPWALSTSFDTACPVTELIEMHLIPDPHNIEIFLKVNEVEVQRGETKQLIFNIPQIISYASHIMTLEPFDLILTGTPPKAPVIHHGDTIDYGITDGAETIFRVEKRMNNTW